MAAGAGMGAGLSGPWGGAGMWFSNACEMVGKRKGAIK